MMAIYILDKTVNEQLLTLKYFAENNIWTMDKILDQLNGNQMPPGDDPDYRTLLWESVKVVFTIEERPDIGKNLRHASISQLEMPNMFPHKAVLNEITKKLGFEKPIEECYAQFETLEDGSIALNIIEAI